MSVFRQTIEINGVKHVLTYGLEFLRNLNRRNGMIVEGMKMATGLAQAFADLQMKDPVVLADFIEIGTQTNRFKPTREEIENFIQELFDNEEKEEELNSLFDTFIKGWRTLPGAKKIEKAVQEAIEEEKETKESEMTEKK